MIFSTFFASIFSRGFLGKINNRILNYALRARGYNNYQNFNESGELFFIREILAKTKPKLCIDIGANEGEYTSKLITHTSAKVIAFEPLPFVFEKLKNATQSYSDRVIYENLGIGNQKAELKINYNPQAFTHASFSEAVKKVSYVTNEKTLIVPVTSLDLYCDLKEIKEIDFIKIDVEGFEKEVFEGAKKCFEEIKPKFIQIEFNWHQMFRNTSLNYFSEKLPDYDVYQLLPNSWIERDAKDPLTNIYYFSNFVFVRRN